MTYAQPGELNVRRTNPELYRLIQHTLNQKMEQRVQCKECKETQEAANIKKFKICKIMS